MKTHYIAVYGTEEEHGEYTPNRWDTSPAKYITDILCRKLVNRLGLKTHKNNPQTIQIKVHKLQIIEDKRSNHKENNSNSGYFRIVRQPAGTYNIDLPHELMTKEEYETELQKTLNQIPPEFWPFITNTSYQRGHSAGYEETLSIAQEMTADLQPCASNYIMLGAKNIVATIQPNNGPYLKNVDKELIKNAVMDLTRCVLPWQPR